MALRKEGVRTQSCCRQTHSLTVAVMALEAASGRRAWSSRLLGHPLALARAVIDQGKRPNVERTAPVADAGLRSVLQRCWAVDPTERPSMAELAAELQRNGQRLAEERAAEEEEQGMCASCWGAEAVVAMVPCGHKCACEGCAPDMERCPMCRAAVEGRVRVRDAGLGQ